MKKILFACAAAVMAVSATTLSTAPALAGGQQVVIETAAFNLNSNAGRSAITDRIEAAGTAVCGSYDGRDTRATRDFNACRDAAVADGMTQLSALSRSGAVVVGAP